MASSASSAAVGGESRRPPPPPPRAGAVGSGPDARADGGRAEAQTLAERELAANAAMRRRPGAPTTRGEEAAQTQNEQARAACQTSFHAKHVTRAPDGASATSRAVVLRVDARGVRVLDAMTLAGPCLSFASIYGWSVTRERFTLTLASRRASQAGTAGANAAPSEAGASPTGPLSPRATSTPSSDDENAHASPDGASSSASSSHSPRPRPPPPTTPNPRRQQHDANAERGVVPSPDGTSSVRVEWKVFVLPSAAEAAALTRTLADVVRRVQKQQEKELRSKCGYFLDFVDEEAEREVECAICHGVLREAVYCHNGQGCTEGSAGITGCGCVFCQSCILLWLQTRKECPNDRRELWPHHLRAATETRAKVDALITRCAHEGCDEQHPLSAIKAHQSACKYLPVPCPNGCGVKVARCKLDAHLGKRAFDEDAAGLPLEPDAKDSAEAAAAGVPLCAMTRLQCKYCAEEVFLGNVAKHLNEECTKVQVECPNKCVDPDCCAANGAAPPVRRVFRIQLSQHLEECPEAEVACPVPGCGEKMKRKDLDAHIATSENGTHWRRLSVEFDKLSRRNERLEHDVREMRKSLNSVLLWLSNLADATMMEHDEHEQQALRAAALRRRAEQETEENSNGDDASSSAWVFRSFMRRMFSLSSRSGNLRGGRRWSITGRRRAHSLSAAPSGAAGTPSGAAGTSAPS